MKKIFFLSLLSVSLTALHAVDPEANDLNSDVGIESRDPSGKAEADKDHEKADDKVVLGASYAIEDFISPIFGKKKTTFYAADGTELLKTTDTSRTIDPTAATPEAHGISFSSVRGGLPFGMNLYDKEGRRIGYCSIEVKCYASDKELSRFDFSKIGRYEKEILQRSFVRVKDKKSKDKS